MIKIKHLVEFDFKDREAADLEKLNRVLSAMKLKDLELKNPRGYLAVTQDGDCNLVHQRYGLDSGTFVCTPAKDGLIYQIDTAVVDHSVDHDEFLDIWRSCHPDRVMRTVITMGFDEALGFIILHHNHV